MTQWVIISIVVSTVVLAGLQLFLNRITTRILHFSFLALKQELKDAIERVLNGDLPAAEPVTPMQLMVMDIMILLLFLFCLGYGFLYGFDDNENY